ncbi:DinB family protein [Streptomyces avicenniae]|uniref:DinB family protein n=1 Tax=Streptomyces avicenniae TaxID=500153 RepID=UPI00069C0EB4|nr:DinB family protein [Streptomyces avicenniae]
MTSDRTSDRTPGVAAEPSPRLSDPKELLLGYLDHYRGVLLAKVAGLTEEQLGSSRLPSGWTPLQLLWHLQRVERRLMIWGFLSEDVPDPWDDHLKDGRWTVPEGLTVAEVTRLFREQAARTHAIVTAADLADVAPAGGRGRYQREEEAPTLGWILHHLLQEYARHAGHLDIVRELADGRTGENGV